MKNKKKRIEELEEWLETHKGEPINGGWNGDGPNEAWHKLREWEELMEDEEDA